MATTTYTIAFGEVLSENRNGTEHDYVSDVRANVLELLDDAGSETDSYDYWPYGEVRSSSGSTDTTLKFVGARGVRTDAPDRTHVGRRAGLNGRGRFSQRESRLNDRTRYSYARCNPVSWCDFNGMLAVEELAPAGSELIVVEGGAGAAGISLWWLVPAVGVGVAAGYILYRGVDYVTGGAYSRAIGNLFHLNGPDSAPPPTQEEWCKAWANIGKPCPPLPPILGGAPRLKPHQPCSSLSDEITILDAPPEDEDDCNSSCDFCCQDLESLSLMLYLACMDDCTFWCLVSGAQWPAPEDCDEFLDEYYPQ